MTLSRLSRIPPRSLSCSTVAFFTLIDVVSPITIMYVLYASVYKPYNYPICIHLLTPHTYTIGMQKAEKSNNAKSKKIRDLEKAGFVACKGGCNEMTYFPDERGMCANCADYYKRVEK